MRCRQQSVSKSAVPSFVRASIAESGLSSRDYFQNAHASVYACLLQK
jgi:hypothetical protein